jgi:very-short-patch-repair endonuclease
MREVRKRRVELSQDERINLSMRVAQSCLPVLHRECLSFMATLQHVCDSPIEVMLGIALCLELGANNYYECYLSEESHEIPNETLPIYDPLYLDRPDTHIIPQAKWQNYRIDFVIKRVDRLLFVECDGHDFHERTPEQAERDRSRDRDIQAAGIPVLRFTGREIYRDAGACAGEVAEHLERMMMRDRP